MLFVDPGKAVFLDGKERIEGAPRAIASVCTGLSLGDLAYTFEFTQLSEATYRSQLQRILKATNDSEGEPRMALEITPSEKHYEYEGYLIQTPFASGGHGIVSAGYEKSTGEAVAIKRLKRTEKSVARIQLEVRIYKQVGDHVSISDSRESILSY